MGAQAQVVQAAQLSLRARTSLSGVEAVEKALWRAKTIVRAWAMRRTMFLLPAGEFSVFVRGTAKRPEYNYLYALKRVASKGELDRLMERIFEVMTEPRTRSEIARSLKSMGYKIRSRAGGGWGSTRSVPWVEVGTSSLPVGFLIHTMAARYAVCSGPNAGNEATYVRADRWLPNWKDVSQQEAEEELLVRYLRAFGPATIADYAIWIGLYIRDAKTIWARVVDRLTPVDLDGQNAWALASDLPDLERARLDRTTVRLLPFFDSFILGHKSHRNIVDGANHARVYRQQGWVSPVVLVGGRALGVWSHTRKGETLEVRVAPFSGFSRGVSLQVKREANELAGFLGCTDAKVGIG